MACAVQGGTQAYNDKTTQKGNAMNDKLDYILAIAEEQNITRAAERLYISQPALTQYINKIEKEYGITLFDRSKKPITLTATGKFFLDEKIRIAMEEQELRRKLELMETGKITINIGCGYSRAPTWMPPLISRFLKNHPDVDFYVMNHGERELPQLLLSKEIDIAFGAFDVNDQRIECIHLGTEQMRLLVPLSFGLFPEGYDVENSREHPYVLKPEQLNGLPVIMPSQNLGSYSSFQVLMDAYSIVPGRRITSNHAVSVRSLVSEGIGYSFSSTRSESGLYDSTGKPTAAFAVLPGLPTERYCSGAYRRDCEHPELISELMEIGQAIFSPMLKEAAGT